MAARLSLCWLALLTTTTQADEALRRDGQRLSGELQGGKAITFRTESQSFPLSEFHSIRLKTDPAPFWVAPLIHRFECIDGQTIHGECLGSTDETLSVRTPWQEMIRLPRAAIRCIEPAGRYRVRISEDFTKPTGWRFSDGLQPLKLERPQQSASYSIAEPLAAGRIACLVESSMAVGLRSIEVGPIRIEFDADRVRVRGNGKPDVQSSLAVERGKQSLIIEWSSQHLDVFWNDRVLWSQSGVTVPPFRAIRFQTTADKVSGALTIHQFLIATPFPARSSVSPSTQHDILIRDQGDELFGTATTIDRHAITMTGKLGTRSWPWTALQSLTLRRQPVPSTPTVGEQIRLRLRGPDGTFDEVWGVLADSTADTLTCSHAWLGTVTIPRSRIDTLFPQGRFRREIVDTKVHHLGRQSRGDFIAPMPEGSSLVVAWHEDEERPRAELIVTARAQGPGTLEVRLNGQRVGVIPSIRGRSQEHRFALPEETRTHQEDSIELRWVPIEPGGPIGNAEIEQIVVESRTK